MNSDKKVIVFFGGSFNPPLISHFSLPEQIISEYKQVDKIIYVPVNSLYAKEGLIDNEHRYNMLKVVADKNEKFEVSRNELHCDRQLYTIESLKLLKEQYPEHEIWFTIGTDNLKTLHTWKNASELVSEFKVIVLERDEDSMEEIIEKNSFLKENENSFVKIQDNIRSNMSSTFAREKLKQGKSIRYLTPDEVYNYIKKNRLYEREVEMGENNQEITILGHGTPDCDSIISGSLMEKLLRSKGYKANYIIPDKEVNAETAELCLKYGVNYEDYMGEVPEDANLFLVDHHKTNFPGKIIGIVDHHPTREQIHCRKYTNQPSSSTAMLIYKIDPSAFDVEDIRKVSFANLIDTNCFSSTKAVESDKEWTIRMCEENELDYEDMYTDALCLTNVTNLENAAVHGEKSYVYGDKKVKSSYVQYKELDEEMIEQFIEILKKEVGEQELDMWVFILHDMEKFKTSARLITEENCESICFDRITSRGSTIMPFIQERFEEAIR